LPDTVVIGNGAVVRKALETNGRLHEADVLLDLGDAVAANGAEAELVLRVAVLARLRARVVVEAPGVLGVHAVRRKLDLGEAGEPGALPEQVGIDGEAVRLPDHA